MKKLSSRQDYVTVRIQCMSECRFSPGDLTHHEPNVIHIVLSLHIELNCCIVIDCDSCLHNHSVTTLIFVLHPFFYFCLFWRKVFSQCQNPSIMCICVLCLSLIIYSPMTLPQYSQYMQWHFILASFGNKSESIPSWYPAHILYSTLLRIRIEVKTWVWHVW